MKEMLDYRDVAIVPEQHSDVLSRSLCKVNIKDDRVSDQEILPIMAAPMPDVIDEYEYDNYSDLGIVPVIPTTSDLLYREESCVEKGVFSAFSMKEVIGEFLEGGFDVSLLQNGHAKVCINTVNGHMSAIVGIVKKLKKKYGSDIVVMAGNVSNSNTYADLAEAGCDYVRVSVCAGSTASRDRLGVYYPQFSLMKACYDVKKANGYRCSIIADGGVSCFADINKALIYADYVMIGRMFAATHDSPAEAKFVFKSGITRELLKHTSMWKYIGVKEIDNIPYWKMLEFTELGYGKIVKEYRPFSELYNVRDMFSDGETLYLDVDMNLEDLVNDITGSLATAMSYTNSFNLNDYKESRWTICRR